MTQPRIRPEAVPRHVAVIMDGNGRWAECRGLPRSEGHRAGVEAVRGVVRAARDLGVRWLTLFAFSSENWNRPRAEIEVLMRLPGEYFATELEHAVENGIRIRIIGQPERLPPSVRRTLAEATERTRRGRQLQLVFALSYGGRAEIVEAARRLLREQEMGKISPEALDEKTFAAFLDDPELPDVDLLIRTGAEARVSNFLLWQIAYAELHLTERMWPDFGREDLERAILDFQSRERRFGLTSAQVRGGEGG
jgi:undecaprenyl diphosphate synthase